MEDTFNSAETNTSMPQNGNLPETTPLQNYTNDSEETNAQYQIQQKLTRTSSPQVPGTHCHSGIGYLPKR